MEKKGLSMVITTLIMVLLVLVAIGIVWVVIKNMISESVDEVSLGKITIDLKIENVDIKEGNIRINVKRNAGTGNLTGIKFIISDGTNIEVIEKNTSMKELGEKKFVFLSEEFEKIDISNIEKVSIAPILKLESGKESVGNVIDSYEVRGSSGDGEECIPDCTGLGCGSDGCGGSCGTCDTGYTCDAGICVEETLPIVLWNKLGSNTEVQNSEVGSNGEVVGSVDYGVVQFDNGVRSDANAEYVKFSHTALGKSKGIIEFWAKPDHEGPYQNHWIDSRNAAEGGAGGNVLSGRQGISFSSWGSFNAYIANADGHVVYISDTETTFSANDVLHILLVWDRTKGFDGDKTFAMYINGIQTASANTDFAELEHHGDLVIGLENYDLAPSANTHIDNLKIYSEVSESIITTILSNRFIE